MKYLHELLAIKDGTKGTYSTMYQELMSVLNSEKLDGMVKTYQPAKEDGEKFPADIKVVVTTVKDKINYTKESMIKYIDILCTISETNRLANAPLVIDNKEIGKFSPTTLLEIEKFLISLRMIYSKIPTLDTSKEWKLSNNEENIYITNPIVAARVIDKTDWKVIVPASDKHAADVRQVDIRDYTGDWTTIHKTGRIPVGNKAILMRRIDILLNAVRAARALANRQELEEISIGEEIFDFINNGVL